MSNRFVAPGECDQDTDELVKHWDLDRQTKPVPPAPSSQATATSRAIRCSKNLVGGDYTLLTGSSCIDVGENRDEWMVGTLDLAGITRKQYGGVDGSKVAPKVDMGAVDRKTGDKAEMAASSQQERELGRSACCRP